MRDKPTAVITGSSGLIGTELCRRYLAGGFRVYGLDKKSGHLEDPNFTHISCDLSKESSIKRAVSRIKSANVLINNAADFSLIFLDFDKVTLKQWEHGLAVNLTSAFILTKLLVKGLRASKGSIINISSTRHLMSEKDTIIYSASKGGLFSLTHSLAITLGPDVRVNCISPGWIANPEDKLKPKDHSQHPCGRVGAPADIAEIAFFLSSEISSFITGQDFVVDGGMTRKMIYT